ncbi:hypothetical protein KDH83_12905 [Achromobacter sp. Marseille-Q0513]|uniref:hypothetical protein n=1 Tax=Achromobacter sp. Marseille-Q0513 TaxID=2829161 RepID=UPI001B8E7A2A|nr:hypothetical protein [Achromobacter sp. Marseille-Q0513]MBR8654193.1 hypothetical protein [Achromobacter sp. Marseille-Q0513]
MAKVLQNFLIGVGLDTEKYDKGAKDVESSLGRMRSLVGFTGAAIVGAFGAAGVAAINAGKRVDDSLLKYEKFKTAPAWINSYGNAIASLGGNADEAMAAIATMEAAIAARQYSQDGIMPGEIDLQRAGVDTLALRQTQTGSEMLRELSRQLPSLNKEQQLRVQQTLGFSDAVMRSLRDGVGGLDSAVARAGELYGEFGKATEAAREYNRVLAELNTQFQGIGETLADKMLPSFTGILKSTSDFISSSREAIGSAGDVAAKSPVGSALVTGSAGAAVVGGGLRAVGMSTLGKGLTRLSPYGLAIGSGMLAWDAKPEDIEGLTGYKPPSYIFENTPMDAARDGWEYLKGRDWWPWSERERRPDDQASTAKGNSPLSQLNSRDPEASAFSATRKPLPLGQWNIHDPDPVYAGGEVSNAEAASASPDVVMVRDQRQLAESRTAPQRVNVQNNLEVRMELDGRALDTKITEVVDRREQDAKGNVLSAVGR